MKRTGILWLLLLLFACDEGSDLQFGDGDGIAGIGGSTATFTISGDYLYTITSDYLKIVNVSDADHPVEVYNQLTFSGLETIFSLGEYLFLGSETAVYIFNISDPEKPAYTALYQHSTGCDPVIANDEYAYITIRNGQTCSGSSLDQLLVLDISDLHNIVATEVIELTNPYGLTFYQGALYVGEGDSGTRRFDLSDPAHPVMDTLYAAIPANDLIGLSQQMIITSSLGVSQYILKNDSLQLLSTWK